MIDSGKVGFQTSVIIQLKRLEGSLTKAGEIVTFTPIHTADRTRRRTLAARPVKWKIHPLVPRLLTNARIR